VIPGDINKINQLTGASLSKTQIGKFSAVSG
jgi:hypothetical protein